jgi:hypothetical protein
MTAARSSPFVRWSLALLLSGCVTTWALACGDEKAPKRVRISVVVILASEKGNKIDKKLDVGKADKFDLVEDQTTSILIQKAADKMDRICLKVGPPMMGEITYSTPCGKFLPILTPYRTKKDQVVIVAIRVQPCNGGK